MVSLSLFQLWDATSGKCVATLTGHDDEILDSCFDYTGKLIATASADGKSYVHTFKLWRNLGFPWKWCLTLYHASSPQVPAIVEICALSP